MRDGTGGTLVLVRHLVDPARAGEYEAAVAQLLDAARSSAGFLWAEAGWAFSDMEAATVAGEWRTREDAQAFLGCSSWSAFCDTVDVCLREDASVRLFASG